MQKINKSYSADIYPISIINRAATDYTDICKIGIIRKGPIIECEMVAKCKNIAEIGNEFDNYLIELLQEH